MRYTFSCVKLGCLQLLAMNSASADSPTVQNNLRRLRDGNKKNKTNDGLTCVLGVKEHRQSHRAEANQGPVVRHGCCSDAVIQGSSVARDIRVMHGRITGFTWAVWMHRPPWLKYRAPALWKFEGEGKELIRKAKGLFSEEWLKMLNIDRLSKNQRYQQSRCGYSRGTHLTFATGCN